jgi:hypothetical protein
MSCLYLGCATSEAQREQDNTKGSAASQDRIAVQASASGTAKTRSQAPAKTAVENKNPVVSNTSNAKIDYKPSEMKVATGLEGNAQLSSKLKPMLPARMTMADAAAGFKKQNQFIAALHASKNMGIPFKDIKAKMTGEKRMSLQDAIRELRPDMAKNDAKAEVKKAEGQAKTDEKEAKAEAKKAEEQAKLAANGKS